MPKELVIFSVLFLVKRLVGLKLTQWLLIRSAANQTSLSAKAY
jgi:hypothetical protein